jgi:putative ABC transport system permease protein
MAISDMTIIGRSLSSRLFSTTTTVLMVAMSVALMLVLLTMREAGYKAFERGSGNMHLLVSRDDSALVSVLNGVFHANPPRRPIEWAKYNEIADKFPLEYAVPVQQGDSYSGFPVLASTEELWTKFSPFQEPGRAWALDEGAFYTRAFEVVLGADVAEDTGLTVGEFIYLTHGIGRSDIDRLAPDEGDGQNADEDHDDHADHEHDDHDGHDHSHDGEHVHQEFPCAVVGILEPTGGPQDRVVFTHLDTSWILHAHDRRLLDDPTVRRTTVADLTEEDRLITGIYLRVMGRQGSVLSTGMQQVFDMLRRDTSIVVAEPGNQIRALFRIVSNVDDVFLGMAAVVLISSAVAIMLALYNSMAGRRKQIAILRVLGTSKSRIFGLVVTESALIGFLGAVVGVLVALAGGFVVAALMKARLGLVFSPTLDPAVTLFLVIATVLLAALAAVIPAVAAYRTAVAHHLRPLV